MALGRAFHTCVGGKTLLIGKYVDDGGDHRDRGRVCVDRINKGCHDGVTNLVLFPVVGLCAPRK